MRGSDKEPLARQLGVHDYLDNAAVDAAAALVKLSSAKLILATITSGEAMSPVLFIRGRRSVKDGNSGTSIDSEDTLDFAAASGGPSMNEVFPLERAAEAYQHMESGRARFRVVLTTAN